MREFLKRLRAFDPQLVLFYDPIRRAWCLLRRPEKYGPPPKTEFAQYEIKQHVTHGYLVFIMYLEGPHREPRDPGDWVINELRRRDARTRGMLEIVTAMDQRNEDLKARAKAAMEDRLRYRIFEDWNHIRDELRGEQIFRKYSMTV